MSKTSQLSKNVNKDSAFHTFDVDSNNFLVGNNQPYGTVSISQTAKGVMHPNVQSAIDDVASLFATKINQVIINTDGISPAGVPQVDTYTFTGVVQSEGKPEGTPVLINVFGFMVEVKVGDTAEEVAIKALAKLQAVTVDGIVFNEVITTNSTNVIQVKYIDYKNHELKPYSTFGITITPSIISPASVGHGSWLRIGTQILTLNGSSDPVTLYYFKRVG